MSCPKKTSHLQNKKLRHSKVDYDSDEEDDCRVKKQKLSVDFEKDDNFQDRLCIIPDNLFDKPSGDFVSVKYINKDYKNKILKSFPNGILVDGAKALTQEDISHDSVTSKAESPFGKVKKKEIIEKHSDIPNKICINCKTSDTLLEDAQKGELVCEKCGMIVDTFLDQSPEWRNYPEEGKMDAIRCSFKNMSLGKGNSSYREGRANKESEYIQRVCEKAGIKKIIIDTAKILFQKITSCKKIQDNEESNIIIRGNNRISIIAACLSNACQLNKQPMSSKKIGKIFGIDQNRVTKGKKQFDKLIQLSDTPNIMEDVQMNKPEDHIDIVSKKLRLRPKQIEMAKKIAKNCTRLKIVSDHTAISIASGAMMLLVALDHRLKYDKKMLASALETSEVTITKIFNKIKEFHRVLINDELTDFIMKERNIQE